MYDLIIIGGGPGGYSAALLGSKKGLSVLLVEKERVGGTCLNRGCIPAKTLISHARLLEKVGSALKEGVLEGNLQLNWDMLSTKREKVVNTLVTAVEKGIRKNGGDIMEGSARMLSPGVVEVGSEVLEGKNVLLAVGSEPLIPDRWKEVLSGEEALSMDSLPRRVVVVGGGVIGVETAYWLASFGVKVEMVEMMPSLIPAADTEMAEILKRELKKRKVKLHLSSPVESIEKIDGGFAVKFQDKLIEADRVIVALGRKPVTGWEGQCIDKDDHGWIEVDEYWRTSMPGHFAVGDITGRGMLAHTAYFGAEQVIRMITGDNPHPYVPESVPKVVFTEPEIAWVGFTEEEVRKRGLDYDVARFQIRQTGRALAESALAGMVKILFSKENGRILGVHIAGEGAGEYVHLGVYAVVGGLSLKDFESMIVAHPTFTEALKEAFALGEGWNIHG